MAACRFGARHNKELLRRARRGGQELFGLHLTTPGRHVAPAAKFQVVMRRSEGTGGLLRTRAVE